MSAPHPLPRRLFLTLAGAAAVVGGATACSRGGSSVSGSGSGSEEVTLRFNWWGSETRYDLTQQVVDIFEAKNPGIKVVMEYAGFGDYFDKLAVSIAGRDFPDLFQVTDPYMYQYIDGGVLQDVTQLEGLDLSAFPETSLFGTTVGGGVYGVPTGESGFAILANPALFDQAGVPIPDDETWSWQDYIDTATAITVALPEVMGAQIHFDEQFFTVFVRQRGEDLWLADGSDIGFTEDVVAAWFDLLLAMRDSGGFPSATVAVELSSLSIEQSPIATGTGAMQMVPFGQVTIAEGSAGVELELLKFPGDAQGEVGLYTKPGIYYALPADGARQAQATMLLDFLVNDPEAAEILRFDRGIPSNSDVLAAITPSMTDAEQRITAYVESVQRADPKPFPHQNVNAGPGLVGALNRFQQQVLFDQVDPATAAAGFVGEIRSAL